MLRKSPGFAAAAILTLALGIGANTAIFSVLNAVDPEAARVSAAGSVDEDRQYIPRVRRVWISVPEYLEFREWTRAFVSVGAYTSTEANLSAPDRPQRVRATAVSDDLFRTLRATARLGRTFGPDDTRPGSAPVVLVSDGLWRSAFGSQAGFVGTTIDIDGVHRTVIGIMPPGFDVADQRADIWLPLVIIPATANRGGHFLYLIGRLADGSTPTLAQAEMDTLLARWQQDARGTRGANGLLHAPDAKGHRLRIDPLKARVVGTATTAVWVLQGAVILVLLIACANLSTLLLSRAESRRREFAVRSALGATSARLLRQSIAEGCLLSTIGGALGLGVAVAGVRTLVVAFPESLPRAGSLAIDWRVLVFTLGVAIATGVIFGIAPLLHLAPEATAPALKEAGERTAGGRHMLRRGLVVCEVALAVALVAGAGLLLRTVGQLTRSDPGFDRSRLVTFAVSLPAATYATPVDRRSFYRRLTDQLGGTPGVLKIAAMSGLPPLRQVNANTTLIEGYQPQPNGPSTDIEYYQQITVEYLDTMGIGVVEGRGFTEGDADGTETVLINGPWRGLFGGTERARPPRAPVL